MPAKWDSPPAGLMQVRAIVEAWQRQIFCNHFLNQFLGLSAVLLLYSGKAFAMTQSGLNVTIIGGGLAGALTARVLREHHNVTVLERSSDPAEVGAAINVAPNGTRILQKLNFDPTRTGSIPVGSIRTWNKSGEVVGDTQRDYAKDYGSP